MSVYAFLMIASHVGTAATAWYLAHKSQIAALALAAYNLGADAYATFEQIRDEVKAAKS